MSPSENWYWVRGEGAPANTAQPFGTAEEIKAYLVELPDYQDTGPAV